MSRCVITRLLTVTGLLNVITGLLNVITGLDPVISRGTARAM
jgi:hypothetical protein